jgi:general transcription factor 3C polypeptide 3 (transcription factor C subunit 4)
VEPQRRPRGLPELSPQVKRLQGDAMVAYVHHQYDKAIPILREVIKIEPASGTAWSTLAQCHKELGEETQALQLDIIGAHLMDPDVDVWRDLGRRSK